MKEENQTRVKFNQKEVYSYSLIGMALICIIILLSSSSNSSGRSFDPASTIHYVKSGSSSTNGTYRQLPTKVYHVTLVPTTANGGILDISGFGLTSVLNIQVMALRNTSAANDVPTVSIKSFSTSSVVYNITQGNNAVVAILGINVLSGTPNVFVPTASDVTLYFQITGY